MGKNFALLQKNALKFCMNLNFMETIDDKKFKLFMYTSEFFLVAISLLDF